jgi:PhnB protein
MAFRPYLAFGGNARDAFTRYAEIFGGELVLLSMADLPPDAAPPEGTNMDLIMHAALMVGDDLLMGADEPSGEFGGDVRGMCLNYSAASPADATRVFDALAEGGIVQMPMGETFFSPAYGMCTDRFGTPWMVMVDGAPPAA